MHTIWPADIADRAPVGTIGL